MALVSMTKRQIRQAVMLATQPSGSVLVGQTGTIGSTSSTTLANTAGANEDGFWKGGWMRSVVTSGSTTETKRITAFTGSTGVFTTAAYSGARDTSPIDIVTSNTTFEEYDLAVERALRQVARLLVVDQGDRTLCLEPGRYAMTVPTGYVSVDYDGVWLDRSVPEQLVVYTPLSSSARSNYPIGSLTTNLERSQGFQLPHPMYIGEVWLPLSKVGSGATVTVSLQTSQTVTISGTDYELPSGTLASATATTTIAASAQGTAGQWVRAVFSTPPFLDDGTWSGTPSVFTKTQYHLVLTIASDSATNYVNWVADDDTAYGLGISGLYGGSSWAPSSTTHLFRFGLIDEMKNWQRLDKNEWRILTESTRTLQIRPETGLWTPTPVKLLGQGFQTSLEGVTAEGTTCTVDPELITSLAVAIYTDMKANQSNDTNQKQIAIANQRQAMERLAALRPLIRGRKVERQ